MIVGEVIEREGIEREVIVGVARLSRKQDFQTIKMTINRLIVVAMCSRNYWLIFSKKMKFACNVIEYMSILLVCYFFSALFECIESNTSSHRHMSIIAKSKTVMITLFLNQSNLLKIQLEVFLKIVE